MQHSRDRSLSKNDRKTEREREADRERRRGLHKGTEVLSSAQNTLSLSQFIEITNMLLLRKMSLKL